MVKTPRLLIFFSFSVLNKKSTLLKKVFDEAFQIIKNFNLSVVLTTYNAVLTA